LAKAESKGRLPGYRSSFRLGVPYLMDEKFFRLLPASDLTMLVPPRLFIK
jgi:hypothetical protein